MGDDGLGPVSLLRLPPNPGVRPPRLAATTGPSAATSDGGGGNGSGEDGGVTASSLKAAAERHSIGLTDPTTDSNRYDFAVRTKG